MKNNTVAVVCIIAATILIACSNQKVVTPSVASFSTATFSPILIPTASYTATAISTPSLTSTREAFSSQYCIGVISPWSCSCGNLSSELIQIRNASQAGLCDITVPLEHHDVAGYNLILPDSWFCSVVGAASNNLRCISDKNQKLFLQSLTSELPITRADEAISIFQEGEGYWSDPIVENDEKKISQELVTIGEKQVLKLLTSQNDFFILRYFMKSENSLYVLRFEMKDPADQESKKTIIILEDAVRSIRFFQ